MVILEFIDLLSLPIASLSILLALMITAQHRGGGPLRLFIQGIALPAFVVGVIGVSGGVFFTFPSDLLFPSGVE